MSYFFVCKVRCLAWVWTWFIVWIEFRYVSCKQVLPWRHGEFLCKSFNRSWCLVSKEWLEYFAWMMALTWVQCMLHGISSCSKNERSLKVLRKETTISKGLIKFLLGIYTQMSFQQNSFQDISFLEHKIRGFSQLFIPFISNQDCSQFLEDFNKNK